MGIWLTPNRKPRAVTVVICTYRRPGHLRRSLLSLAAQRDLPEGFEVVVSDDGSQDDSEDVVADFAKSVDFPVGWTTHEHNGYHVSRTRNAGIHMARGEYLLLLDGDCIVPPDHLSQHLRFRRPRRVVCGDCCRLDELTSQRVTDDVIISGEYQNWAPPAEIRRLRKRHFRTWLYHAIRHPRKPFLIGNDVGVWHADCLRVNGFDENYRNFGCEDDDFGMRLRWAGVQIHSILAYTCAYHLWHPVESTATRRWRDGANVAYFLSRPKVPWCENGLRKEVAVRAA